MRCSDRSRLFQNRTKLLRGLPTGKGQARTAGARARVVPRVAAATMAAQAGLVAPEAAQAVSVGEEATEEEGVVAASAVRAVLAVLVGMGATVATVAAVAAECAPTARFRTSEPRRSPRSPPFEFE